MYSYGKVEMKKIVFLKILIMFVAPVFLFNANCPAGEIVKQENTLAPFVSIDNADLEKSFLSLAQQNKEAKADYYETTVIVPNPLGLHSRPAGYISRIAKKYPGTKIFLQSDQSMYLNEPVDATEILAITGLGIGRDARVKVFAQGKDAGKAVEEINAYIKDLEIYDSGADCLVYNSLEYAPLDIVILGNKGLRLAKMYQHGINVPKAFIVRADYEIEPYLKTYLDANTALLGSGLFGTYQHLSYVLSVRSSPSQSLPGAMDTILNVGMNEIMAENLGERGWEMFSVYLRELGILGLDIKKNLFDQIKVQDYKNLTKQYAKVIKLEMRKRGEPLEEDGSIFNMPLADQLELAILAVKKSKESELVRLSLEAREKTPEQVDTAVIVQVMKFGSSFVVNRTKNAEGQVDIGISFAKDELGEEIVDGRTAPKTLSESGITSREQSEIEAVIEKISEVFPDEKNFQVEGVIDLQGKVWVLQQRSMGEQDFTSKIVGGKELISQGQGKKVQGKTLIPKTEQDFLSCDSNTAYVLCFEDTGTFNTGLLLKALSMNLNIVGVLSQTGTSQSHFSRQLIDVHQEIPYISGINIKAFSPPELIEINPDPENFGARSLNNTPLEKEEIPLQNLAGLVLQAV
ncbi:MAG: hypothetical protein DRP78_00730 [Candidatus Omnitrophota bacterium]|nr:MAG: hypothetical protein DRP78_00730 [Candidatus Omnitrophota bacterium]